MLLPKIQVLFDNHFEELRKLRDGSTAGDLVRESFDAAMGFWHDSFTPLRFTNYAFRLGYNVAFSTTERKLELGAPDPLVWTGATRVQALQGHIKVTGKKNPKGRVKYGRTWPLPTQVLSTKPPKNEMTAFENEWASQFNMLLEGIVVVERTRSGGIKRTRSTVGVSNRISGDQATRKRRAFQRRQKALDEARDFAEVGEDMEQQAVANQQETFDQTKRRLTQGAQPDRVAAFRRRRVSRARFRQRIRQNRLKR